MNLMVINIVLPALMEMPIKSPCVNLCATRTVNACPIGVAIDQYQVVKADQRPPVFVQTYSSCSCCIASDSRHPTLQGKIASFCPSAFN